MSETTPSSRVDEIHVAHEMLREMLEAFDLQLAHTAVDDGARAESAAIVDASRELARRLTEHFEREESRGYLPDIYELAPRYSAHADRLLAEHADLLTYVNDIAGRVGAAASGGSAWGSVLEAFRSFANRLRRHEQAESSLVRRALMEDIGN